MNIRTQRLVGAPVKAGGCVVGKIDDVFFDVRTSDVTHMSVALTGWFRGTIVLVPMDACCTAYVNKKVILTHMSAEDIGQSPLLDDEAVWYPQYIQTMMTYYDCGPIWMFGGRSGVTSTRSESIQRKTGQCAIWASRDLMNSSVADGNEGELGRIEDLVVDTDTWHVGVVLVRQGHWYRPERMAIAADNILEVEQYGAAARLLLDRYPWPLAA